MSLDHDTGIGARLRTSAAKDHRRNSSIVLAEVVLALGLSCDTVLRGSSTMDRTP